MSGRKAKMTKNTMFYSEDDFNFESEIGLDYITQDMNQTVLVFQVDRAKSSTIDIYGESVGEDSISYKDPVEINVVLKLDTATNKSYDKAQNVGRYLQVGNISFGVYSKTLSDNKIDISYGDYIGVQVTPDQMEYFVVTNDGRVNFDNAHSMFGFRNYYRTIMCSTVDKSEFKGV